MSDIMNGCETYFSVHDLENLVNHANEMALAEVKHRNTVVCCTYIFFLFELNLLFLFFSLIL